MGKYFLSIVIVLSMFATSCKKDDDGGVIEVNVPPSAVSSSSVTTETIEGTVVKVSWKAATDQNNDPIVYDVVVNDKIVANKTSETSVEFDASEFISVETNTLIASKVRYSVKGITIELVIKIKVYDDNSAISEEIEVKKNILVNRIPGVFEFVNVDFDTYYFNYINISWTPGIDPDGDLLSYDIYLNELLISEDYVIGSDDAQGSFFYNESFEQYINEEIVIKVVANDNSGGLTEISESFNFRATDIDLGSLAASYENSMDFVIEENEPDHKIGYTFVIEEATGFSAQSSTYSNMTLRNQNGDFIGNAYNNGIHVDLIETGTYYLEVSKYYSENVSGVLSLNLGDPKASDIDLGLLTTPYNNTIDFSIPNTEIDSKIGYTFQVNETTGYSVMVNGNASFGLQDSNGNDINFSGNSLAIGTYYLILINNSYNNNDVNGTITIVLDDFTTADEDLGVLTAPYNQLFNYTTIGEVDQKVKYNFTIDSSLNYVFEITSGDYDTYLYLYNSDGNYIGSNDDGGAGALSKINGTLNSGSYYIEVAGFGSQTGTGTLSVDLQ